MVDFGGKTLAWASKIWEPLATGPPTIEFNLVQISTHIPCQGVT